MNKKKAKNYKYGDYFYRMHKEFETKSYFNRSNEIKGCLNYWLWDKYELNKLLDLNKVNRCKSRFCPNCKQYDVSKFIHKFRGIIENEMQDYNFYFLTLTIPSVSASELEDTLLRLNKSFARFKELYSYPKLTPAGNKSKKAYQDRLIDIAGGIRVLEITYNYKNGYHPHYHIFVMTKEPIPYDIMQKKHIARYSTKRKQIDFKSDLEKQISRVWSEIWYNTKIDDKQYQLNKTYFDEANKYKVLEVDFREFDEKGIYETIKYTVKDSDIVNYDVFKTLYFALFGKRIRQGFGVLYNLQVDDSDLECGQEQELILEFVEEPKKLVTKNITELLTTYKDYKKIARKTVPIDNNIQEE